MDGFGVVLALIFGAAAAHSLWTGEAGWRITVRKEEKPVLFWMFIAAYLGFVVLSLLIAFGPSVE